MSVNHLRWKDMVFESQWESCQCKMMQMSCYAGYANAGAPCWNEPALLLKLLFLTFYIKSFLLWWFVNMCVHIIVYNSICTHLHQLVFITGKTGRKTMMLCIWSQLHSNCPELSRGMRTASVFGKKTHLSLIMHAFTFYQLSNLPED